MKKKNQSGKKLSLNKVQFTKLTNLYLIRGGSEGNPQVSLNTCGDPENGSRPVETILGTMK